MSLYAFALNENEVNKRNFSHSFKLFEMTSFVLLNEKSNLSTSFIGLLSSSLQIFPMYINIWFVLKTCIATWLEEREKNSLSECVFRVTVNTWIWECVCEFILFSWFFFKSTYSVIVDLLENICIYCVYPSIVEQI